MDKISEVKFNYGFPLPLPPHESESDSDDEEDVEENHISEYESEEESKESDQDSVKSQEVLETFPQPNHLALAVSFKGEEQKALATPKKSLKRKRTTDSEPKITLPVLKQCLNSLPQIQVASGSTSKQEETNAHVEPTNRLETCKKQKLEILQPLAIDLHGYDLARVHEEHEVPSSPKHSLPKGQFFVTPGDSSSDSEGEEDDSDDMNNDFLKSLQETFSANKKLVLELQRQFRTLSSLSSKCVNPTDLISHAFAEANQKLELRLNEANEKIESLEHHPVALQLRDMSEREEEIDRLEEKVEFLEGQLQESRVVIKFLSTKMADLEKTFSK